MKKDFIEDRKKDPVRRSVWLCAHRDFWRIGLQHSSRSRPRYRARRGENSGCGGCGETTHVNSRANHFACVSGAESLALFCRCPYKCAFHRMCFDARTGGLS